MSDVVDFDDKKLEEDCALLLEHHGPTLSRILTHLTGVAMLEIRASGVEDTAKREAAYHEMNAIRALEMKLQNLAAQYRERVGKENAKAAGRVS